MVLLAYLLALTLPLTTSASPSPSLSSENRPSKPPFNTLVTFGDSYTDNGRLSYYINHSGSPPPPGVLQPTSNTTASGGLAWGQFAAQYASASSYVDYAISGATCSNKLVSRLFSAIGKPFPSVMDDEIPSFQADVAARAAFLNLDARTGKVDADETVYALWIGTNDLGYGGFLSDSQTPGASVVDFVECVFGVFDAVYKLGGRRFVVLNEAPLEVSPLYQSVEKGGVGDGQFWANKTLYNTTEYSYKLMEYTRAVNLAFEYGVPFQLKIKNRWPEARFSVFDVHSLLVDIYYNPKQYLDAPYNATGYYHHCVPGGSCTNLSNLGPLSGFMWYDELHPSEKTDSIIAKNFLDVLAGNSTFGVTYS